LVRLDRSPVSPPVALQLPAGDFERLADHELYTLLRGFDFRVLRPRRFAEILLRGVEVRCVTDDDLLIRHCEIDADMKPPADLLMPVRDLEEHATRDDVGTIQIELSNAAIDVRFDPLAGRQIPKRDLRFNLHRNDLRAIACQPQPYRKHKRRHGRRGFAAAGRDD